MKPVHVRFACKPDPVVRRQLQQMGANLPEGQTRSLIFRGYLCKVVGERNSSRATVIDMPIRLLGFRGPLFRLGERCPLGFTSAGKRANYAPSGDVLDGLSASFGAKHFVNATYGSTLTARAFVGSVTAPKYGEAVARGSTNLSFPFVPTDQVIDGFFNGCDTQQFQLSLQLLTGKRLGAVINDNWLGEGWTFATAYGAKTLPALVDAPAPAGFGESPYRPRWSVPQPRQVALPAVEWIAGEPGRLLVAAQVAQGMPEHHFILTDKVDGPKWYSLQYPHAKAATPAVALLQLVPTPVPEDEPPAGVVLGIDVVDAVPSWAVPSSAPSAVGQQYLALGPAVLSLPDDWPSHLRPAQYVPEQRWAPGFATTDFSELTFFPDISGEVCYRPCVLGQIHSTIVGGVAEFVCAVRATDEYLLPITSELRDDDAAGITPGEQARVKVTRTGLLVVQQDLATGVVSTDMLAPDVLGSVLCPWYDAGGMDADIAYLPQVLWGGVLDGKRCYAVRAVRYQRSIWLGSLLQDVGGGWWWFTDNYRGWRYNSTTDIRPPMYRTDLGFGPYIDRTTPEELWWVVDGVVQPITLPANYRAIPAPRQTSFAVEGQFDLGAYLAELYAHMGIYGNPGLSDQPWQEYALEEYLLPNMAMQQFAQVAPDRVVYFLPPDEEPGALKLMVFDGAAVADYGEVSTPWASGTHYTGAEYRYPVYALTCYQREVWADGEMLSPAGLLLTVTSGERGYCLISQDGGTTWSQLLTAPDSFETDRSAGIPGHGYIFTGSALWKPQPGYPYAKEAADG